MQQAKKAQTDRLMNALEQRATRTKTCRTIQKKLSASVEETAAQDPKFSSSNSKDKDTAIALNVSEHVWRTLTFHNAVIHNLRSRYRKCTSQNAKRRMRNLIMGRTIRQYKMQMFCRDVFGFSAWGF